MKQTSSPTENLAYATPTRICGHCRRELPLGDFYLNKKTLTPDSRCKECRRVVSSQRYHCQQTPECTPPKHPVLITDPTLKREFRILLLQQARQVVRESVERKRRRDRNAELEFP